MNEARARAAGEIFTQYSPQNLKLHGEFKENDPRSISPRRGIVRPSRALCMGYDWSMCCTSEN